MYEAHFGITGAPFQLGPDPDFYFDTHGHHRALAALRRGLSRPSGFTVISGEIGAGKTTLVRAVIGQLKPESFSVAQIVSTQLDADQLLTAVAIGFGISSIGAEPAAQAAKLRHFLADIDQGRRRAVLIIDEAQNLSRDAFDRLVGFARREAPRGRGMQICLVGQPELQTMLETVELSAVREQVCVSCHLGPIDPEETGVYVEHRLTKVGWSGVPSFEAGAYEEIHRWTDGIPRRINQLCNRLLWSRFLANETIIGVANVVKTARDLRAEFGDSGAEPPPRAATTGSPSTAPRQRPTGVLSAPRVKPAEPAPVLCVAASLGDHVRAGVLMAAMARRLEPPAMKLVRVYDNDALALSAVLFAGLDGDKDLISLGISEGSPTTLSIVLEKRFELVLGQMLPKAVIVFDEGVEARVCSAVARAKGVSIVRIGNGADSGAVSPADAERHLSIIDPADLTYTTDLEASRTLLDAGVPADHIHCTGSLLGDAVQMGLSFLRDSGRSGEWHRMVIPAPGGRVRYGLLLIDDADVVADRQSVVALLAHLRGVSRHIALVWPIRSHVQRELDKHCLRDGIFGERIFRLPAQPYANHLELLRHAACVVSNSTDAQEEAGALGVPCLTIGTFSELPGPGTAATGSNANRAPDGAPSARTIWRCKFDSGFAGDMPVTNGEGERAGARMAYHLCAWLARIGRNSVFAIQGKTPTNAERRRYPA
jgi:general secretion pathway protein A